MSQDGTTFDTVVQATLPAQGEPSDNFAFVLQRDLAAAATHVCLRVLSGYRTEHWGVGEFEVFGSGVDLTPENRETPVTTDLEGLTKGTTYHYRLIAENAAGRSYGPDQTYTTPATSRPVAATGAARNVTAGSARLQARFNPLGVLSEFYFEYGTTKEYGAVTRRVYGGEQLTPRAAYADISGLQGNTQYHYRIVVENAAGTTEGEDAVFTTSLTGHEILA